jgi:cyclase
MVDIFEKSNVDAALAATIFHYNTHGVNGVKKDLREKSISVRL